jgi:hypothetical protein
MQTNTPDLSSHRTANLFSSSLCFKLVLKGTALLGTGRLLRVNGMRGEVGQGAQFVKACNNSKVGSEVGSAVSVNNKQTVAGNVGCLLAKDLP